jgi:hypothetical protein
MIWLAWRQHRKQALFTGIGLAAIAALLLPTGLAMRHSYSTLHIAGCTDLGPDQGGCGAAVQQFNDQFGVMALVAVLLVFLPLLLGLFWGAPLVARELEHGTHRLVWTQGVSRRRWALVKFGLVGGVTAVAAACYGLGMAWWFAPLSWTGNSRLDFLAFDSLDLVPVGYTLFAVALGIFAGTVWQRVLPAMAVVLTGFLAVRIPLTALARPRYLPALSRRYSVESLGKRGPSPLTGDWERSSAVYSGDGRLLTPHGQAVCAGQCVRPDGPGSGAYNLETYQPASRFWPFQLIETGIYVALAAALIYLAVRRIRRIA